MKIKATMVALAVCVAALLATFERGRAASAPTPPQTMIGVVSIRTVLYTSKRFALHRSQLLQTQSRAKALACPARGFAGGKEHRTAMAGVGQDEPMRPRLKHRAEERHEHARRIVRLFPFAMVHLPHLSPEPYTRIFLRCASIETCSG